MPTNNGMVTSVNGEAPNNWFFSWVRLTRSLSRRNITHFHTQDAGLVHYISISTEIQGGAMLTRGGNDLIKRQFEFLENDLKKANLNRENVPCKRSSFSLQHTLDHTRTLEHLQGLS